MANIADKFYSNIAIAIARDHPQCLDLYANTQRVYVTGSRLPPSSDSANLNLTSQGPIDLEFSPNALKVLQLH